jgi:hypothetical protein
MDGLAKDCIEIFNAGKAVLLDKQSLDDIAYILMSNAGLPFHILQTQNGHWIALALCMMTHGRMFYKGHEIQLEISNYIQESMWWDNVEYYRVPGKPWEGLRRKSHETEDTRSTGDRENNRTNETIGKGNRDGDFPYQNSLFDLH